jgi:hypothetical protein
MVTPHQIAIDCTDPHAQARFWAAAMDLEVEDHHDQIQQMVADGYATSDDHVEIDGRLAWRTAAACRSEDRRTRLLFQVVPEAKVGKNRVHLDLVSDSPQDQRDTVARLLALGATHVDIGQGAAYAMFALYLTLIVGLLLYKQLMQAMGRG